MTGFKWACRIRILATLILAGFMFWAPHDLMQYFDLGESSKTKIWIQAAGIFYIYIAFGYIASAFAASKSKAANIFPLFAPILPIILFFCLGGNFLWLALFELVFLIILHVTFRRGFIAELMAFP